MARTRKPFSTIYVIYTRDGDMTEYMFTAQKAAKSFIKTDGEEGDVVIAYTLTEAK